MVAKVLCRFSSIDFIIFELIGHQERKIQVPVPGENSFDLAGSVLSDSATSAGPGFYQLQFKMSSTIPVQLQLLSAESVVAAL